MKVHLTGSSSYPGNDMPYLRCIVETLHKNRVSIVLNWVEAAYNLGVMGVADSAWAWGEIIDNNLDALSRADALIVEGTNHGFFQGFQVSKALERKLPVLFLTREVIRSHPISGIDSKLLNLNQYKSKSELELIISNFVEKYSDRDTQLKISEKASQYLRGESLITGKSELEIIDGLLNGRIS